MVIFYLVLFTIISFAVMIILIGKTFNVPNLIKSSLISLGVLTLIIISVSLFIFIKENDYSIDFHLFQTKTREVFAQFIDLNSDDIPYGVYNKEKHLKSFSTFTEAVEYAKSHEGSRVYYREVGTLVWQKYTKPPKKVIVDAPVQSQLPELPRGCEVTSLSMLLAYAGHPVDKMELAEKLVKDPTPYKVVEGNIYFGNPYDGFVGNMYTKNEPGLGVYHGPIRDLAEQYLPSKIIDMTGASFEDILFPLQQGKPVWVIINSKYETLPNSAFQRWQTPSGPISITYYEHSVLITGYDENTIFFNDPLQKFWSADKTKFAEAWVQMGSQAITYVD